MRGTVIDTGLQPVWSEKSTSTEQFIPLTGAMDTTSIDTVRVSWNFESDSSNGSVRPGYQYSNDGVTWSDTPVGIGTSEASTGWSYNQGSATTLTSPKLFVRFGILMKNASGVLVEQGMAQLRIEVTPKSGRSILAGPTKVWSDGTVTAIFHPLTSGIPYQDVGEIRVSCELESDTGDAELEVGYQVSNDGLTWYSGAASASAGSFGTIAASALTGEGKYYGSSFTGLSLSERKQQIRFGVAVSNGSAGNPEACLAKIRVDYRQP